MHYTFRFETVFEHADQLLLGAWLTIRLSALAMLFGLVVALMLAVARKSRHAWLRWFVASYIEAIRNTPFLVQIFLIFFGLPSLGVRLSPETAVVIAMVINVSAYSAEIVRAGIESIDKGQVEAGRALGLRPLQIFRGIILKPALRAVYPALTSQFILLMLGSSVASTIAANELTSAGNNIQSVTFTSFEVYIVVTVIYFAISSGFSALFSVIERSAFAYDQRR